MTGESERLFIVCLTIIISRKEFKAYEPNSVIAEAFGWEPKVGCARWKRL
ncbi:hypothetical protein RHBI111906_02440 [Rhodothermus bifroesti]|nr:hypothetical protein HRbin18_01638 [bacterium HR18]